MALEIVAQPQNLPDVGKDRYCPWCGSALMLIDTSLGPQFICRDDLHKDCRFACGARWMNTKIGYVPNK